MRLPPPEYSHLLSLIDDTGIYEHARYGVPRREHGYTLDDASRALIVLCEGPDEETLLNASRVLLAFVLDSFAEGRFRNRLTFDRRWVEEPEVGDTQGRGIWALAVAATRAHRPELRGAALSVLQEVPTPQSSYIRPLAYAALGAHALWRRDPLDPNASRFAAPAAERLQSAPLPWPENRLSYANGRVPAAFLAAGEVFGDEELVDKGLRALAWLVSVETNGGHFSFTPVGGWEPGEARPGFDQQPVEAAALSDACERAWLITDDRRWKDATFRCGAWLLGSNDSEVPLYDESNGVTLDGLMERAANANSGAESTIAGLAVLQACHRVAAGASPNATRQRTDASH